MYEVKDLPLDKKVLTEYPDLSEMFYDLREQFNSFKELTGDQVLRYIILVYHFNSPLVQSKADLMWRKKQAMMLAGVPTNKDGFFGEEAMQIIANLNIPAIDLKMRFVRSENNMDWVELCAFTEVYFDYIRTLSDQSVGNKTASEIFKVKQAIIKESEGLKTKIDTLSNKVFKGDVDLANYVGSTIVKDERRLRISPEVKAQVDSKKKAQ